MKAKTESHKQKISKSKIEAFKKRFIEKFKFQINEKILSLFYDECIKLKSNPSNNLKMILTWLERLERNISQLDSDSLCGFLLKRKQRKEELKNQNKDPSIIDLSLYEIYAETKEQARYFYDEMVIKKTKYIKENPTITSGDKSAFSKAYHIKKYGDLSEYRKTENWLPSKSTTLEYWLKQGLSIEEAQKSLKERQSTFSKQKCIERYRRRRRT